MKLCRFRLDAEPEKILTGIYKNSKIYQTEGMVPVSVHEVSNVEFLKPIGTPFTMRKFESFTHGDSVKKFFYQYGNPLNLLEPAQFFSLDHQIEGLDIQIRIACMIQENILNPTIYEVQRSILGFIPVCEVVSQTLIREEIKEGMPVCIGNDLPLLPGALLITEEECYPNKEDDLNEHLKRDWNIKISHGDEILHSDTHTQTISFNEMIRFTSKYTPLRAGELLLSPPFNVPSVNEMSWKRYITPGDELNIQIEDLGAIQVKLL